MGLSRNGFLACSPQSASYTGHIGNMPFFAKSTIVRKHMKTALSLLPQ